MLIHASVPGASDGRVGPARWPRWPLPQPRHATYTMHTFPQDLTHFNKKQQIWYTSKRGDGKHRHLFTASADLRVLVVPGVPHGCRCLSELSRDGQTLLRVATCITYVPPLAAIARAGHAGARGEVPMPDTSRIATRPTNYEYGRPTVSTTPFSCHFPCSSSCCGQQKAE